MKRAASIIFGLTLLLARLAIGQTLVARIDDALSRAVTFLEAKQDRDGAWRSKTYGLMKDGPSLTPHVLTVLSFIDSGRASFDRGHAYLLALMSDDGSPRAELRFPIYGAAEASWVMGLSHGGASPTGPHVRQQMAWIDYLRARQLNRALGWSESDPEFGGWGYSPVIPRKPDPGAPRGPIDGSNLSATLFALGALRAAKIPFDDPAYRDALVFVKRCQNFSDDPKLADAPFDDGGFFFCPDDDAKNKAGVAGTDAGGRKRFHSYGSATCDGIRALLACGAGPNDPRVIAARAWILKNFSVTTNPGVFERDREVLRDATYYYYCWSLAHAMTRLGVREIETPGGEVDWRVALCEELLRRQNADGSWVNRFSDSKEDDPLVATPFAASVVAVCRKQLEVR